MCLCLSVVVKRWVLERFCSMGQDAVRSDVCAGVILCPGQTPSQSASLSKNCHASHLCSDGTFDNRTLNGLREDAISDAKPMKCVERNTDGNWNSYC